MLRTLYKAQLITADEPQRQLVLLERHLQCETATSMPAGVIMQRCHAFAAWRAIIGATTAASEGTSFVAKGHVIYFLSTLDSSAPAPAAHKPSSFTATMGKKAKGKKAHRKIDTQDVSTIV